MESRDCIPGAANKDEPMLVILDSSGRKEYAADKLASVPVDAGMVMEIRAHKYSRSLQQNKLHWLLMTAISQQMPSQMGGEWHAPESWHELFKRMFLGVEAFSINGQMHKAPKSSRKLTVAEFSEFYAQCDVWAAEHSIMIGGDM